MADRNGWITRLAVGLALVAITGGVGVYAQVRSNTDKIQKAEKERDEARRDLKEINGKLGDVREDVAAQSSKIDSIYDVIVKGRD